MLRWLAATSRHEGLAAGPTVRRTIIGTTAATAVATTVFIFVLVFECEGFEGHEFRDRARYGNLSGGLYQLLADLIGLEGKGEKK